MLLFLHNNFSRTIIIYILEIIDHQILKYYLNYCHLAQVI